MHWLISCQLLINMPKLFLGIRTKQAHCLGKSLAAMTAMADRCGWNAELIRFVFLACHFAPWKVGNINSWRAYVPIGTVCNIRPWKKDRQRGKETERKRQGPSGILGLSNDSLQISSFKVLHLQQRHLPLLCKILCLKRLTICCQNGLCIAVWKNNFNQG